MAEVDKVYYRTEECDNLYVGILGINIFREFYSKNRLGFVTKKSELIAYLPALSDEEMESARKASEVIISHYELATKNILGKIGK